MPPDEREIGALEESPILFWLSGTNERLRRHDQSNEESASSADSIVQSPRRKPTRRLTLKEKGKKKMSEYGTERDESDRHESDSEKNEDEPSETKFVSTKKVSKSANEQSRQSTHQKTVVVCFGYNEYMGHHYAYMTRVAEVRELESYAEAAKDANWHAAMEEEMCALAENETWDLVDAPKSVKPI